MLNFAFVVVILGSLVVLGYYMGKALYIRKQLRNSENRPTTTGETFGERQAYHARGELSPGEHALAQQIRESLGQEETSKQGQSGRTIRHWFIDEQEVLDIITSEGYRYAPTHPIADVSEGGWYDSDYPIAFNGKRDLLRSYGTNLSALTPEEREAKEVEKFDRRFAEEPSSQE